MLPLHTPSPSLSLFPSSDAELSCTVLDHSPPTHGCFAATFPPSPLFRTALLLHLSSLPSLSSSSLSPAAPSSFADQRVLYNPRPRRKRGAERPRFRFSLLSSSVCTLVPAVLVCSPSHLVVCCFPMLCFSVVVVVVVRFQRRAPRGLTWPLAVMALSSLHSSTAAPPASRRAWRQPPDRSHGMQLVHTRQTACTLEPQWSRAGTRRHPAVHAATPAHVSTCGCAG